MGNRPGNRRIIRATITLLFLGLLGLPIVMDRRNGNSGPEQSEIDAPSALRQFGFYLEEVSRTSGISFRHTSPTLDAAFTPILQEIASMGASVSICDFNGDGWHDIYVTSSRYGSMNALFQNQKDGQFREVAGKLGIADLNRKGTGVSMGSVWADYDNDGFEDLFIYKWGRPTLFRNDGGTGFTETTEGSGLPGWINANTAIWLDYNSDGLVDLFIGGYFPEELDLWDLDETAVLTESFEYSFNGGRNFLLRNRGDGTFEDVTADMGLSSTRWTLAAGAVDVDRDGFPELIIANDYGTDEFFFNQKGTMYVEKGSEMELGFTPKSGMNVSFGDVRNTGELGIYISNITEEGILLQGNNFWVPRMEGESLSYQNQARQSGIESGGWSYAAQFGDLNNDGHLDLYVANGFISGKPGTSYWYDYTKVTGGNRAIISDIRNWPALNGRSHSGYQRNRVWINTGSGFFYDVAEYVSGIQTYDSRAVAMADLWNRGALDVIVASQDSELLLYRNWVDPERHWIDFQLTGSASNRSAIGAVVTLHWEGGSQAQVVSGGIGFSSQNQRRLHFGLGTTGAVDSVTILWPGGTLQVLEDPRVDRIHEITQK